MCAFHTACHQVRNPRLSAGSTFDTKEEDECFSLSADRAADIHVGPDDINSLFNGKHKCQGGAMGQK